MKRSTKIATGLIAGVALATAAAGVAVATTTTTSPVTFCVAKNGGVTYASNGTCSASQTAVRVGSSADVQALASRMDTVQSKQASDESAISDLQADDTANQILAKLKTADGSGSGLDADMLDGHDSADLVSDHCVTGFVVVGPLCWEQVDHFGYTLSTAAAHCQVLGGRLPLLTEFMALMQDSASAGWALIEDWTASSVDDDQTIYINNQSDATNPDGVRANSTVSWARCVADPINALGSR